MLQVISKSLADAIDQKPIAPIFTEERRAEIQFNYSLHQLAAKLNETSLDWQWFQAKEVAWWTGTAP